MFSTPQQVGDPASASIDESDPIACYGGLLIFLAALGQFDATQAAPYNETIQEKSENHS